MNDVVNSPDSVDSPQDNAPDASIPQENSFSIPDDYKKAQWTEGLKSTSDVWKKLANSQELIGKKTILPIDYNSSSPEQVSAYHKSIVPEDVSLYKFSEDADAEFSQSIIPTLQEAGIHPKQLAILEPAINEIASKIVGEQYKKDRSEENYFELTEKAFGDGHKDVVVQLEKAYGEHLSDDSKGFLDSATNADRVAFDQVVKSILDAKDAEIEKIRSEYGAEETGLQAEGETASNKVSIDDEIKSKREELRLLDSKPGQKDWAAINKSKQELRDLYNKKTKMRK